MEVGAKEFVRFVSIVHVILHKKHFVIVDNFMNFTYAYLIDEKLDDFLSKIISQFNPYPWIFETITKRVFWKKIQNYRWWRHSWD